MDIKDIRLELVKLCHVSHTDTAEKAIDKAKKYEEYILGNYSKRPPARDKAK